MQSKDLLPLYTLQPAYMSVSLARLTTIQLSYHLLYFHVLLYFYLYQDLMRSIFSYLPLIRLVTV